LWVIMPSANSTNSPDIISPRPIIRAIPSPLELRDQYSQSLLSYYIAQYACGEFY
jgi:hypothetical protein